MNGFGASGGMARTCRHACLVQNGSMQVVHAWDGYTARTKLAGPGVGQWFCDFGFGPLIFF